MATPKPSGTNCPRSSFRPPRRGREPRAGRAQKQARRRQARHPASPEHDAKPQAAAAREPRASHTQSGGYGGGVPPLPIPNREVKPARADGTAHECGRVGCRPLQTSRPPADSSAGGRFFCAPPRPDAVHCLSLLRRKSAPPLMGRPRPRRPSRARPACPDGADALSRLPAAVEAPRPFACRAALFPVTRPLSRFCP